MQLRQIQEKGTPINSSIQNQTNGVGGITVKVLYRVLKKYKSKIISGVKKINKNWGVKLESKYSKLLSYIEKGRGGVQSVLENALVKIGFKKDTAELIADVILTIVSWLI